MALGTDVSGSPPTQLTTLTSFTVNNPGQYYVQNLSAGTIQVVLSASNGTNATIILLAPGGAAGTQGADTNPPLAWFTGLVTVAGASGAEFVARHN